MERSEDDQEKQKLVHEEGTSSASEAKDVSIEHAEAKEREDYFVSEKSEEKLLGKMEATEVEGDNVCDSSVSEKPTEVFLEMVSAAPSVENKVEASQVEGDDVKDVNVSERSTEILLQKVTAAAAEVSTTKRSTEIILKKTSEEESVAVSEIPVSVDSAANEGGQAGEMPDISTAAGSLVQAPAPLLEHPATWWNCCGLLDMLKGSQR